MWLMFVFSDPDLVLLSYHGILRKLILNIRSLVMGDLKNRASSRFSECVASSLSGISCPPFPINIHGIHREVRSS